MPLCSLLSGGLDSSAITALAALALRGEGAGPATLDLDGYRDAAYRQALSEVDHLPARRGPGRDRGPRR